MSWPKDRRNLPRVAIEKPDTPRATLYTHNWCDPTTWAKQATRVVDETASDSGDQLTYNLAQANIIDTYHGKTAQEDFLLDSSGNSYRVVVKVDAVTKTEQDPHLGTGGDYTVSYVAGDIVFLSALTGSEVVLVTYHYAGSSQFCIIPDAGTALELDVVEVQFSEDVDLKDSAVFQMYGFVECFAPELMPGIPEGTKIPVGNPSIYKTMRDYVDDAVRSYPQIPAMGGASWRGMAQAARVFDWDYVRATRIEDSKGMELRIKLEHDIPFGGTFATATLYCGAGPEGE